MTYRTRCVGTASLGLALGLGLWGCSDNSSSSTADMAMPMPDLSTKPATDMSSPNPDALTTAFDDQFIGYWGVKSTVVVIQDLPFFGMKKSTQTILDVGQFRHDAMNKLVMDTQECRVTVVSEVTIIKTTVPDKIADTSPMLTGAVQVYGSAAGMLGFHRAEVATGIGCHLTVDPFNEALPTDKTDTRVFDQDTDTNPGVTVMQTSPVNGSIYVVQRRKFSYQNGIQAGQGRLTGNIVDRSSQYILDATDAQLKTQVSSKNVDDQSVFEMVKLPSAYTCTQLKADADAGKLFTM